MKKDKNSDISFLKYDNLRNQKDSLKTKKIKKDTLYKVLDIFTIEDKENIYLVEVLLYNDYWTIYHSLKKVFKKTKH